MRGQAGDADAERGQNVARYRDARKRAGSLPISESGNWITSIQNMMANVVSVMVSFLVAIMVMA